MKKYDFPRVKVDKIQRIWLEAMYEEYKKGRDIDVRELKANLWGQIPQDFDPIKIDWRLAPGGRYLTLLGIWHLNQSDESIQLLDEMLFKVQEHLRNNPKNDIVSLRTITLKKQIGAKEKERLLKLIRDFTNRFLVISSEKETDGDADVRIGLGTGEAGFDFFYRYSGLANLIREQFEPEAHPSFQPPQTESKAEIDPNTAFVLMWMNRRKKALVDVYNAIKRVCDSFGIRAYRVDEIESSEQITDAILDNIKKAQYIIADLSGSRPNVYYEVGYAQALGKQPILIKKEGTKVHFDLYVHKATEYESMTDLEIQLTDRLEKKLGHSPKRS